MLKGFRDKVIETLKLVEQDWKERGFIITETGYGEIITGECNNITIPCQQDRIGTFHAHTLNYSRPSDIDLHNFLTGGDDIMCYAAPKEDVWVYSCMNKDMSMFLREEV